MLRLTTDAFRRAESALSRPLDRARWLLHFGDGDPADLRAALAGSANPDGGYGNALEPDLRLPASSVIATTVGLQHLVAAGADGSWPEIGAALRYLAAVYDPDLPGWEPVPPGVDDHPHAVWWDYRRPDGFEGNPGVEVLGYFLRFPEHIPGPLTTEVVHHARERLASLPDEMDPHEFLNWARLAASAPAPLRDEVLARCRRAVPTIITHGPDAWAEYAAGPLWVAPIPHSPFHDLVAGSVDAHLDWLVARQGDDGSWPPAWTWHRDEDHWPRAEADWRSVLTVEACVTLAAYGRIETA